MNKKVVIGILVCFLLLNLVSAGCYRHRCNYNYEEEKEKVYVKKVISHEFKIIGRTKEIRYRCGYYTGEKRRSCDKPSYYFSRHKRNKEIYYYFGEAYPKKSAEYYLGLE